MPLPNSKYDVDEKNKPFGNLGEHQHGGQWLVAQLTGQQPLQNSVGLNIVPWIALHFCKKEGR
jgi:hypothetical protein